MIPKDATARAKRCAIYTRKSSEEGLEQDFNSLHAQREACEAYIKSQAGEDWTLVPTPYDDGGFSGGSMERPALKRLLANIEAGRIDIVVVYKVDRLSRALTDFARMMEVFDTFEASFVSVTQAFNTTTSMGRLTLNVLLSFAQFEREVTGERIRDKFAASRAKGLWMGGHPPPGYDVKDRKLVVRDDAAPDIRLIYERYVSLSSVTLLKQELDAKGLRTKVRVSGSGRTYGNKPYARGALYGILRNRAYIGDVVHKGKVYPGEHDAIIDANLWHKVQARLDQNQVERSEGSKAKETSLLAGVLFDDKGKRLSPYHVTKKGKRYRYYVTQAVLKGEAHDKQQVARIPARDIEALVTNEVRKLLQNEVLLTEKLLEPNSDAETLKVLLEAAAKWRAILNTNNQEARGFIRSVLCKVTVSPNDVRIQVMPSELETALLGRDRQSNEPIASSSSPNENMIELKVHARVKRCGMAVKLMISDGKEVPALPKRNETIVRAIARAHHWKDQLVSGEVDSIRTISRQTGHDERYVARSLRLAFLAPDIAEMIIDGNAAAQLSLGQLLGSLPLSWKDQRSLYLPTSALQPKTDEKK